MPSLPFAGTPARFDRERFFPSGLQLGTKEFLSLFPHRYDYIYRSLTDHGTWLTSTSGWQLSDTDILKAAACAHTRFFLGARPGKASKFAVLDIDARSKYHNEKQLKKILASFADAGLDKNVLYRSSRSGGWHVYFFFAEFINSQEIYSRFHRLLSLLGFVVEKGQLEIFPHPGQHGSSGYALRLPLQPGFAWLDKNTQEVLYERDDLYALEAMGMFTADLHEHSHTYTDFQLFKQYIEEQNLQPQNVESISTLRKISASKHNPSPPAKAPPTEEAFGPFRPDRKRSLESAHTFPEPPLSSSSEPTDVGSNVSAIRTAFFGRVPPGINFSTWLAGRSFMEAGLDSPGQRAEAIFSLSHYFFYGDPEREVNALGYGYEDDRQWLIEKIIAQKHNDNSDDINKGRADAFAQIERAAHWLPPQRRDSNSAERFVHYGKQNIVWIRANAKRRSQARIKIANALEELKASGKPFTVRQLWKKSGCSTDTIYKHEDIWRQEYEDLANGFFAADPGECNAVLGGVIPANDSVLSPSSVGIHAGLLAARRIVFELSMGLRRDERRSPRQTCEERESKVCSWRSQVFAALSEALDPNQTFPRVKTLLAFLILMLMSAPSEDDLVNLQTQIGTVKSVLVRLMESNGLQILSSVNLTVRAPPDC